MVLCVLLGKAQSHAANSEARSFKLLWPKGALGHARTRNCCLLSDGQELTTAPLAAGGGVFRKASRSSMALSTRLDQGRAICLTGAPRRCIRDAKSAPPDPPRRASGFPTKVVGTLRPSSGQAQAARNSEQIPGRRTFATARRPDLLVSAAADSIQLSYLLPPFNSRRRSSRPPSLPVPCPAHGLGTRRTLVD